DCDKCGGIGWIVVEHASVSAAEACTCRTDDTNIRRIRRANIPPLYEKASLENFVLPGFDNPVARADLAKAYLTVKAYVTEFPWCPKPGLLFVGDQGCGKTHLAVAAIRGLMEKGHNCVFFDYQTLLDKI